MPAFEKKLQVRKFDFAYILTLELYVENNLGSVYVNAGLYGSKPTNMSMLQLVSQIEKDVVDELREYWSYTGSTPELCSNRTGCVVSVVETSVEELMKYQLKGSAEHGFGPPYKMELSASPENTTNSYKSGDPIRWAFFVDASC